MRKNAWAIAFASIVAAATLLLQLAPALAGGAGWK